MSDEKKWKGKKSKKKNEEIKLWRERNRKKEEEK
jgi:hypothetical protein